jgi:hypothetical protein
MIFIIRAHDLKGDWPGITTTIAATDVSLVSRSVVELLDLKEWGIPRDKIRSVTCTCGFQFEPKKFVRVELISGLLGPGVVQAEPFVVETSNIEGIFIGKDLIEKYGVLSKLRRLEEPPEPISESRAAVPKGTYTVV